MISTVTWLPSNVCKEWPDKVNQIPIKNLPIKVDNFMTVEPEIVDQFLNDDSDENSDDDNDNSNNKNSRKRKFNESDNDNDDNDNNGTKAKKQKLNNDELSSEDDDERFGNIEDPKEFANAVLEGYDDDDENQLDFLSRIAGLHSGIAIGPTSYDNNDIVDNDDDDDNNDSKNRKKKRNQKHNIIKAENIYDTKNDSEIEDIHIRESDEIFICLGSNEDGEAASMRFNTFDTEVRTFYEHHDIILPTFPLCCKWLKYPRFGKNLMAIGTVDESIEIFNLDIMDELQPICSLGGRISTKQGNNLLYKLNQNIEFNYFEMNENEKEITLGKLKKGSHSNSVLSLDWNKLDDCHLLSSSADRTIKIWDLNKLNCINTLKYHTDKVQKISLQPNDPSMLISGGFDKKIFLSDIKNKHKVKQLKKYNVSGEIETLKWHPLNTNLFIATMDNGYIECFDIRKENKSLWNLKGHKKAVTSLSFNNKKKDIFATSSLDKYVKIWRYSGDEDKPSLLLQKQSNSIGAIFSIEFAPSRYIPTILLMGGQENFAMWDISSEIKDFEEKMSKKETQNEKLSDFLE